MEFCMGFVRICMDTCLEVCMEEKKRRREEEKKKRREEEIKVWNCLYGTLVGLCMEFCMGFVRICMDTCLEVWNTSFCVESFFGMVVWFDCDPQ